MNRAIFPYTGFLFRIIPETKPVSLVNIIDQLLKRGNALITMIGAEKRAPGGAGRRCRRPEIFDIGGAFLHPVQGEAARLHMPASGTTETRTPAAPLDLAQRHAPVSVSLGQRPHHPLPGTAIKKGQATFKKTGTGNFFCEKK